MEKVPWLKMSKKVELLKIPLAHRGIYKIKATTLIPRKMHKVRISKNQYLLLQQLTHKMCVKMGMIPSSLRMCWGSRKWKTLTMSIPLTSSTYGRGTPRLRKKREHRGDLTDWSMGHLASLNSPSMTRRTLRKRGCYSVSLPRTRRTKTETSLSRGMILRLRQRLTTLGWLTQRMWQKVKKLAKLRKRKKFL